MWDADVVVVGGGPVGLGVATCAALRGLRVVLLERHRRWPIDKACGEGLMPGAVEALAALGVGDVRGHPFGGIRYVDGDVVAEGRFPDGTGRGVRRLALSEALAARAGAVGVDLRGGVDVEGWTDLVDGLEVHAGALRLRTRWLVAADGVRSPLRRRLGVPVSSPTTRQGVRRHFRAEAPDFVEVHWGDAAELYLTPVEPGVVGVAVLSAEPRVDFDALLATFPAVARRLGEPVDAVRGSGPYARLPAEAGRGRVFLAGDAAGYLDALTGEGIALGLTSADALLDAIVAGSPARWTAALRRHSRRHVTFTRFLLEIAARPALRARVVRALAERPDDFSACLGFNAGQRPLAATLPSFGRLFWGTVWST